MQDIYKTCIHAMQKQIPNFPIGTGIVVHQIAAALQMNLLGRTGTVTHGMDVHLAVPLDHLDRRHCHSVVAVLKP